MTSTLPSFADRTVVGGTLRGVAALLDPAPVADSDPLTERSRLVWGAGAYDRISAGFRDEAADFVSRQQLTPGDMVLDVAAGSGNLTIPAARSGASVTGLDLVPSLLAVAADRAARESLTLTLDVGNAEALPYADAQFDVTLSMFGVMFAARPDRVMAELARVTRPGGRVALANWTRDGFIGQLLGIHVRYVTPPADVPSPILWGDEGVINQRFDVERWRVQTTRRILTFKFPHSPEGVAELFRGSYGPTVRTFAALGEDRRAKLADELTAHWVSHARMVGETTEVDSTYLEVEAVRR